MYATYYSYQLGTLLPKTAGLLKKVVHLSMQGVGKYFGVEGQISNRQTCCELDSKFYITIKEITIVSSEKFVDWPISS